jgi:HEAT repeat protein
MMPESPLEDDASTPTSNERALGAFESEESLLEDRTFAEHIALERAEAIAAETAYMNALGPGPANDIASRETEPAQTQARAPIGSHPLAEPLHLAADAKDEERFLGLVETVLHEPDESAVGLLSPFLGRGGAIGRVAAHGLLMLGPSALQALLDGIADANPHARQAAAWALGSLRDPRATEALVEALNRPDASQELIQACLDSLGELSDRKAVPALLAKLRDPAFADHRPSLCRALGHIGDPQAITRIIPLLSTPKPIVRLRAAEALVRLLDKRGWPVLFALLRGDDPRGDSTVAALRGLGELSSALAPFLGDDDYPTRRDAAEVLGSFGDGRAVTPLIEALGDINHWVRGAAAYALGRLGDRKAFKWLLMMLKDDSAWVRQSSVRGLGLLGDPRARRPLEEMLFDGDTEISTAAQEALNAISER